MRSISKTIAGYSLPSDNYLKGRNYLYVIGDSTETKNASELKSIIDLAKKVNPNNAVKSATNQMTIVVGPGVYRFGNSKLVLNTPFINIISLTGSCDVLIDGLTVTSGNINLKGIDCGVNVFDIADGLTGVVVENCRGLNFVSDSLNSVKTSVGVVNAKIEDYKNSVSQLFITQTPVATFNDLATTYPGAEKSWSAMVVDEGFIYTFNGDSWKSTGLTAFPKDVLIKGSEDIYNVTDKNPPLVGLYDNLQSAIVRVPISSRKSGQKVRFLYAAKEKIKIIINGRALSSGIIQIKLNGTLYDISIDNGDNDVSIVNKILSVSQIFTGYTLTSPTVDSVIFQRNMIGVTSDPAEFLQSSTGVTVDLICIENGCNEIWQEYEHISSNVGDYWTNLGYWKKTGIDKSCILIASRNARDSQKSIADYVCNGIDDEVLINRAISIDLAETGGIIQLTGGTFYLSGSIIVNRGGIIIRGEGRLNSDLPNVHWGITQLLNVKSSGNNYNADYPAINLTYPQDFFLLQDLCIKGVRGTSNSIGVNIGSCDDAQIQNCYITEFTRGINISLGATNPQILDNWIEGNITGVVIKGSVGLRIRGNLLGLSYETSIDIQEYSGDYPAFIQSNMITSGQHGVYVKDCRALNISGNNFYNCGSLSANSYYGILIDASNPYGSAFLHVVNNLFDGNNCTLSAIRVLYGNWVLVSDNTFYRFNHPPIIIDSGQNQNGLIPLTNLGA